jgi:hypothetical protein
MILFYSGNKPYSGIIPSGFREYRKEATTLFIQAFSDSPFIHSDNIIILSNGVDLTGSFPFNAVSERLHRYNTTRPSFLLHADTENCFFYLFRQAILINQGLYFLEKENSFYVSDSLSTLSRFGLLPKLPDLLSVQEFLNYSEIISDTRTFYKGLKRFPRGTLTELSLKNPSFIEEKKLWEINRTSFSQELSLKMTIELYRVLTEKIKTLAERITDSQKSFSMLYSGDSASLIMLLEFLNQLSKKDYPELEQKLVLVTPEIRNPKQKKKVQFPKGITFKKQNVEIDPLTIADKAHLFHINTLSPMRLNQALRLLVLEDPMLKNRDDIIVVNVLICSFTDFSHEKKTKNGNARFLNEVIIALTEKQAHFRNTFASFFKD